MTFLAILVLLLSLTGFALSVVAHIAGWMGTPGPLGDSTALLHLGIFAVWTPIVLIGSSEPDLKVPPVKNWRFAVRGCPAWIQWLVAGLFLYCLVNFVAFFVTGGGERQYLGHMSPENMKGVSGHWMFFYGAGAALAYSYLALGSRGARKCERGHTLVQSAQSCPCGAPVEPESGSA